MKNIVKVSLIILFLLAMFIFSFNNVQAINLNTIDDSRIGPTEDEVGNFDDEEDEENDPLYRATDEDELDNTVYGNRNSSNENVTSETQVQVTTTQNKEQGLTFEGAATVILIAIGVVLILLAVAILIKFK